MTNTILQIEKRKNYPDIVGLYLSLIGSLFTIGYVFSNLGYEGSFRSNNIVGTITAVLFYSTIIVSFIGFCFSVCSPFYQLIVNKKVQNLSRIAWGIFLPILNAGFIMPTLGLSNTYRYSKVTNPVAYQFIESISEDIDRYTIQNCYDIRYEEYKDVNPPTIEVNYKLKPLFSKTKLPESFAIVINLKTREVEMKKEDENNKVH